MWRTLYALGLALPRIVFRPLREFELIIPEAGAPLIAEQSISDYSLDNGGSVEEFVAAEVAKIQAELRLIDEKHDAQLKAIVIAMTREALRRNVENMKIQKTKEGRAEK